MSSRRKGLLLVLPLLVLVLFLGMIGPLELTLWLVVVAAWLYAFFGWARTPADKSRP